MTPEEMRERSGLAWNSRSGKPHDKENDIALYVTSETWEMVAELAARQDAVLEELRLLREAVERIDIPSPLHPPIPMVGPNTCGPPSARHT